MVKAKEKFALWLTPDARDMGERNYRADNCISRSEYIEKAVRFYTGYLHAQEAGAYLPRILAEVLESKLIVFGDRVCKLLFKLAVQEAITANLIAADTDVDLKTMETLTGTCVKQVTRVHGALGYEDALRFQKRLD